MPGCPQDHTGQRRLTVLGPGMEENSFPKKQFKKTWKISTTQVSAQTEWGREVFYGRPAEDSNSSAKRQGRKETLSLQGSACTPDTFCPMMLGSPSFLTGSDFSCGQVLVLLLEHACSSWMRGLPQPPRVNLPSVSCPSLPTLCPDSPFYFALI